MGASTKEGHDIAIKSRKIVRSLIKNRIEHLNPSEQLIVERIVHSTADPDYADLTEMSNNFVDVSTKALRDGLDILTDINMVRVGITKYDGDVKCYINHEKTIKLAKKLQITRAAAAMDVAVDDGFQGLVAIGNSPTALLKVVELAQNNPDIFHSVVGVPVGFVAASESKDEIKNTKIPNLITKGPKGGTPVAVAVVNALINLVGEDEFEV